MSTPTPLNGYRITWASGDGDGSRIHAHEVQATNWAIDPSIGFAIFKNADDTTVFAINVEFLVAVERVTEKS
jgi:hypothetical protein